MRPGIEVVGAEAALYPVDVERAARATTVPLGGPTLAEGIAVKNVGKLTLPIVRDACRRIVLVDEAHLERAVDAYLTLQKTMAEGAGAAGLAAMLVEPERFRGRKVGLILCGGNIDPRILASVMVRELERERPHRVVPPDHPGPARRARARSPPCSGELGANILEVDHRRLFLDVPAKGAQARRHGRDARPGARRGDLAALAADGYQPVRIETATHDGVTGLSAQYGSRARIRR